MLCKHYIVFVKIAGDDSYSLPQRTSRVWVWWCMVSGGGDMSVGDGPDSIDGSNVFTGTSVAMAIHLSTS